MIKEDPTAMRSIKNSLLLSIIFILPFLNGKAQEASSENGMKIQEELVNFSTIATHEDLYFKVTIESLKENTRLILEKETPGKEGPTTIGTERAIGTDNELPLLYCFKDQDPDPKADLYRLRSIRVNGNGVARSTVLLERKLHQGLMSMNAGRK